MPEIKFHDVSVAYEDTTILRDINASLTENRIGIIGANGGGKSTLVRLINGLGEATRGTVTVDGQYVAQHGADIRRKVGFVFSDAENQIVMPTVRQDIAFSLKRFKLGKEKVNTLVDASLHRFGLQAQADQSPHTLSGGQKQLLALAAVTVLEPQLIIADEPTTLLDLRNRDRIKREFAQLDQQVIVVTHDLEFLDDFDRVLCIDQGRIVADGQPAEVIDFYRNLMIDSVE
ncbi:MAG: ABC transporter ATP-binding protein [Corynebacterium camporealensis]|uniref:energy-coupling factor ABC transporter ATP-binding protein n=1 Tax=Corynebacterium camporealensis TaxID=161896 RepID=UPI002A91A3C5|nr:ABC transporter ATP-binding protein [Corynebacterium camporealensis]MDY5840454.1 ABC transporter ATP-binding protein [Corynebacterium camporealensis]